MTTAWVIVNDGELRYPVRMSDLRPGDTEQSLRAMTARQYDEWATTVPAILKSEPFELLLGTPELNKYLDSLRAGGYPEWFVPYVEKLKRERGA